MVPMLDRGDLLVILIGSSHVNMAIVYLKQCYMNTLPRVPNEFAIYTVEDKDILMRHLAMIKTCTIEMSHAWGRLNR